MQTAETNQPADAQADVSLRWAHMPFCCFSHEAARITTPVENISLLEISFACYFINILQYFDEAKHLGSGTG